MKTYFYVRDRIRFTVHKRILTCMILEPKRYFYIIDLNGVFPLFNNNANFNFQTTNLNLNNNLRTNLWFRKENKEE